MPRPGSVNINSENSDYCHNVDKCKNCYLLANAVGNRDCMYGRDFYFNDDCIDCDHIQKCTLSYQCVSCKECWNSNFLQDCENCTDCDYGYDLKDCKNCIGCVGLRKKEFHIFNAPYSKEDFAAKKRALTPDEIMSGFSQLKTQIPRRALIEINAEQSLGDNVLNSKNIILGFDVVDCQDCGYVTELKGSKDCWDIFVMEYSELCYEIGSSYKLNNCNFCFSCWESSNLELCEWVGASHDCFGCAGIYRKQFHILNQPYEKEAYFKKVAELKDQLKAEGMYGMQFITPTYPFADTVAAWDRL